MNLLNLGLNNKILFLICAWTSIYLFFILKNFTKPLLTFLFSLYLLELVLWKIFAEQAYLLPNLSEWVHYILFRTLCFCWIFKTVMNSNSICREVWTSLSCIIANSYDTIKRNFSVLINMIRSITRNIDARFC
jgi:hypothetical protein